MAQKERTNALCGTASRRWHITFALAALTLTGCDPISLTAMGVGAAAGVQHTLTGIAYRTFSVPLPRVRTAVLKAFDHMGTSPEAKNRSRTASA